MLNFSLSRESLFVAVSVLLRARCCPESFSSCLCCSTSPKNRFKVILKLYFYMSIFDLSVEYRRILVHLEMTGALGFLGVFVTTLILARWTSNLNQMAFMVVARPRPVAARDSLYFLFFPAFSMLLSLSEGVAATRKSLFFSSLQLEM